MNKILLNETPQDIRDKVILLQKATKAYDEGNPIISDQEWDTIYYEVSDWEKQNNVLIEHSPTNSIFFIEVSKLKKVEHNHPMLSLAKTKNLEEIKAFCGDQDCIAMLKMDGLTCSLLYENGKLVRAETRGDGYIGEDVTHNARLIKNIPQTIDYQYPLTIDGEVICTYDDFQPFAPEYKNPRNFAAGSIRLLNANESYARNLSFIAWDCFSVWDSFGVIEEAYAEKDGVKLLRWGKTYETLSKKFTFLIEQGFEVVPYTTTYFRENLFNSSSELKLVLNELREDAINNEYPIDGLVFKYNNCAYYDSLGSTSHHFRGGLAFKFFDEVYETRLLDIEWTMGRTGTLTPVAIFEPVETENSIVTRANLHNISVMYNLYPQTWHSGLKLSIYLANDIIPQVQYVEFMESPCPKRLDPPKICPICAGLTAIQQINDSKELVCTNPECQGKLINKLDHFCSKKGLDIKGLSKATLEKLIDWGWVSSIPDIYKLIPYANEWKTKTGFGDKSVDNILAAIEESKTCSLDKFIAAIGIPLIGNNVAKELTKHISSYEEFRNLVKNKFKFWEWEGFAEAKTQSLWDFNYDEADEAYKFLNIPDVEKNAATQTLDGLTFVITGRLTTYKNRDELKAVIEKAGGKVAGSISGNTNYLINNDINSNSSKNKSAKERGIPIISEEDFNKLLNK